MLELDFTHEGEAAGLELKALRPERDLRGAFLARNVKRRMAELDESGHDLQQKRRLADAGVAADQGDASLHKPASHDSVEFAESRHGAGDLLDRHVGEVLQGARRVDEAACGARGARTVAGGDALRHLELLERVPGLAVRALSLPLGSRAAALIADEFGSGLGRARCHRLPYVGCQCLI